MCSLTLEREEGGEREKEEEEKKRREGKRGGEGRGRKHRCVRDTLPIRALTGNRTPQTFWCMG